MRIVWISAWVALVLAGCAHEHAHDHGEGGDPHAHEDEGPPAVGITAWSETLELYAEHTPAVVGQPMPFAAHLTVLDGFRALDDARVRLVLEGPSPITAETTMQRSGIYRFDVTPAAAGTYRGRIDVIEGSNGSVGGFELVVYADQASANASVEAPTPGAIAFLKEQQWRVPFATAFAERGTVRPTVEVPGELTTPPEGSAHVHAPVGGRVMAGPAGFPTPGQQVERGAELASLAPTPSAPEQATRSEVDVVAARAQLAEAREELARAERLLADRAIPERRVAEARRRVAVAEASVAAASRARAMFSSVSQGGGRGSWRVTAPIAGIIDRVHVSPGEAVDADDPLFEIIDPTHLWLTARVPESWASRIRPSEGASFHLAGDDPWRAVDGALIFVSNAVDPTSRTVTVTWSLAQTAPELRIGAAARVAVPVGDALEGVVIPSSALVDVDGRDVVYVQHDGEHFLERPVRTGPSDGSRVAILEGVSAGERVVTRGGYLVRLASRSGQPVGPGHVH